MGYRIRPLDALPGIHIEFFGEVTGATFVEALGSFVAQIGESDEPSRHTLLWDGRGVTSLVVDHADVPAITTAIQEMQPVLEGGRSAIVFQQGQFDPYLFAKLLSAKAPLLEARERAMFTDYDAACTWLKQGSAAPE